MKKIKEYDWYEAFAGQETGIEPREEGELVSEILFYDLEWDETKEGHAFWNDIYIDVLIEERKTKNEKRNDTRDINTRI